MTLTDPDLTHFQDLHDLVERAVGDVVPAPDLHVRVLRAARRGRARRRLGFSSGVLVAAAAVVVAVVSLPMGGGVRSALDPAARPTSHPTHDAQGRRIVGPGLKDGWWRMPVADMHSLVAPALPHEVTIESWTKRADPDEVPDRESTVILGVFRARLGTATGPGSLEIMLNQRMATDIGQDLSCPPGNYASGATITTCTQIRNRDGRVVGRRVESGPGAPGTCHDFGDCHTIDRSVTMRRGDGFVSVAVANSIQEKWTDPVSSATPPLTLDQLQTLAELPWDD